MVLTKVLKQGVRGMFRAGRYLFADKDLWRQFSAFDPWVTKFKIDGNEYGGWYEAAGDRRLLQFKDSYPVRASILELGSLEGGHTFVLARMGGVEKVVALEGRDYNIKKAEFVKELLGIKGADFRLADLEKEDLSRHGRFDVVFSLGLLYHLPQPWIHLREVRKVTDGLFLWTHCVNDDKANVRPEGYPGWEYREYGFKDPLSGLSKYSFWPTLEGLKKMLIDCGFPRIEIVEIDSGHGDGLAVTLAAKAQA